MDTWSSLALVGGGTGVFFDNTWSVGNKVWLTSNLSLAVYRTRDVSSTSWHACDGAELRMCSNVDKTWKIVGRPPPRAIDRSTARSTPIVQPVTRANGSCAPSPGCFMQPGYVQFAADPPVKAGRDYFGDTKMPVYVPLTYPDPLTCTLE